MAAQPTFSQNTYAGDVFERFLVRLVEGTDIFDKGLASMQTGINKRLILPKLSISADIIQNYAAEPSSQGTMTVAERYLDVKDLSVYIADFNPNDWRRFWQPFAPSVAEAYNYLQLNETVRVQFIEEILKRLSQQNAYNIWQGDTVTTGATYAKFDGIITKMLAQGNYVDAAGTSAPAAFTANNVQTALNAVMTEIVARPALHTHPNLTIICSPATKFLYQQSDVAVSGKGPVASTIRGKEGIDYYGVPLVESTGFPDNTLLATYTDGEALGSNLHVGLRNVNDITDVILEKKANGSHNWFFRMDYSIGTQVGVTEDCIYYGAY